MRSLEGTVLVTGGAGFIGSALIWGLNRRGVTEVVVADVVTPEKEANLRGLRFSTLVHPEELRVAIAHDRLGSFSCIFHLGACSSTTETNLAYLLDNNFGTTRDLCRWALAHNTRFIYASSAATYGDGKQGMDDDDTRLSLLRPLNHYAYSKHLFDLFAQSEGFLSQIYGLKYFNVFGPHESHKGDMRSVVHKAFDQIRSEGRMTLFKSHRPDFADGEQRRDFLYVKDAVDMTLHFAETDAIPGGLYNLGSGVARSWLDLAHALFAALGRRPDIRFVDMPEALRAHYQYYTCADTTRLQKTGYDKPLWSLEEAVGDCIRNHLVPGKHLGEL
ncbi:MAG: ADP-glyceromanno-heptose 6-epimerase [Opitutaceae bacterium]|nr:ADP-glyceromanno-heptose 6-epimerase [Opitutaceae bacterium]